MIEVKNFFNSLNFNMPFDLQEVFLNFDLLPSLNNKITGNTYRYIPLNEKTQTTFTVFNCPNLTQEEEYELRNFLWNEHISDLYFVIKERQVFLYYTFTDPRKPIVIDTFESDADEKKLSKLIRNNFDTGLFWEIYREKLDQIQKKRLTVDKGLIKTLRKLRELLQDLYSEHGYSENKRDEIIQALIDRTLFIKYLEDKHIINKFFFQHYFQESNITFITLLINHEKENVNKLFYLINKIFNNTLFENPHIPDEDLLDNGLSLIANALSRNDFDTGQLSLFGYRFDVIPTEFIGHVYEMFFDEKQSEQGIFYTPEGLAKLIVESVIEKIGTVIDPSCGSGMFLVVALRKLFEISNLKHNIGVNDISKRNKVLSECIYGIEKQGNARRLTILSLYLELLSGISTEAISLFIEEKILEDDEFKLFPFDFTDNILQANALSVLEINGVEKFDYIVGNPPFHQIRKNDEEVSFWNENKGIISNGQISQCFFIKLKVWAHPNSKFGFISNTSNFNSDTSTSFQSYFFGNYRILSFFNLGDIKSILFENAKESTSVIIFNNDFVSDNSFNYITPKLTKFARSFKVVLLRPDDIIKVRQNEICNNIISLRDLFIGEPGDLALANKIQLLPKLSSYLQAKNNSKVAINNGMQMIGADKVSRSLSISNWNQLSKDQKEHNKQIFINKFVRIKKDDEYPIPYIDTKHIEPFKINESNQFLKRDIKYYKNIFERIRTSDQYEGKKVLFTRVGNKIKACYSESQIYYSFDIYSLKLKSAELGIFIAALLNSSLIDFYLLIKHRKRVTDSYPKITMKDILSIPIPTEIDAVLLTEIDTLAKKIANGSIDYLDSKSDLDNLLFNIYSLSLSEKQRIRDFFKANTKISSDDMGAYVAKFIKIIRHHISPDLFVQATKYIDKRVPESLVGVKISFENKELENENLREAVQLNLLDLIKEIGNKNIHTTNDKLYRQNSIIIMRENDVRNWTLTKATEDATSFLKELTK